MVTVKQGRVVTCESCGGTATVFDDGTKLAGAAGPTPCVCPSPQFDGSAASENEAGPARTVGELRSQLARYSDDTPIRVAHAITGDSESWQWIVGVAPLPPANEVVGLFYLEP